jgi:hypothetical protein
MVQASGRAPIMALRNGWFVISWYDVWNRLRLKPQAIPGVRLHEDKGGQMMLAGPKGRATVHRSHLAMLGYTVPVSEGEVPAEPGAKILRPHQVTGVKFIRAPGRPGVLLTDEQRVGKTPQIVYAHEPRDGVLIIVGPVASRMAWHEWAARRFGRCALDACTICDRAQAVKGDRPSFIPIEKMAFEPEKLLERQPYVLFASFATIRGWQNLYAYTPIATFAIDEAHLSGIQNRKNPTVQAVRKQAATAQRVILATGTPLYNKPRGLWPLLDMACPGAFGDYWPFAVRYCDAQPGAHGWSDKGISHEEELRLRLAEVMLRRTWNEVKPDLPPVTRSLELVDVGNEDRSKVDALANEMRYGRLSRGSVVGDMQRIRQLFARLKWPRGVELAQETIADGHNVILWAWHREIAQRLVEHLVVMSGFEVIGPIHGALPPGDREELVNSAHTLAHEGRRVVLVATMGAAAVGLNLSFATHEIFVELDWTPVNMAQAEMRPYNGEHPVSATFLVADCETDRDLANSLIGKLEAAQSLGLRAGVGDARDILRASLKVEDNRTLDDLCDRLMATIEAEM